MHEISIIDNTNDIEKFIVDTLLLVIFIVYSILNYSYCIKNHDFGKKGVIICEFFKTGAKNLKINHMIRNLLNLKILTMS